MYQCCNCQQENDADATSPIAAVVIVDRCQFAAWQIRLQSKGRVYQMDSTRANGAKVPRKVYVRTCCTVVNSTCSTSALTAPCSGIRDGPRAVRPHFAPVCNEHVSVCVYGNSVDKVHTPHAFAEIGNWFGKHELPYYIIFPFKHPNRWYFLTRRCSGRNKP